jgi:hypothetical protein
MKTDLYAYFTPEILDPYQNIIEQYDKARDKAADSLIHDKATQEKERKNPVNVRERKFQDVLTEHMDTVFKFTHDSNGAWLNPGNNRGAAAMDAYSINQIRTETGLSDYTIRKVIAHLKRTEGKL